MIRLSSGETSSAAPTRRGAAPVPSVQGHARHSVRRRHPSNHSGTGQPPAPLAGGRPALRADHARSSSVRTAPTARIESDRDRVEDELDVVDALVSEPRRTSAMAAGGLERAALLGRNPPGSGPVRPAGGPSPPRCGRPRPGRVRRPGTAHRRSPGGAAEPSGRLPKSANQLFHASASAIVSRSIRGPFDPISNGSRPGRGPRGSNSQSRAA